MKVGNVVGRDLVWEGSAVGVPLGWPVGSPVGTAGGMILHPEFPSRENIPSGQSEIAEAAEGTGVAMGVLCTQVTPESTL